MRGIAKRRCPVKEGRRIKEGITMEAKRNDRKSVWMMISSMLIFGTIGVFRKYIPVSSAFLAFSRGLLGEFDRG